MGRLWDKFTGTRHAAGDIAPRSAEDLSTTLLGLNRPDVRYVVRNSTREEGADLVAECKLPEVRVTLKVRMRLDQDRHEVRALEERWKSSEYSRDEYSRGPAGAVYSQWRYEKGPAGHRQKVEVLRFDTRKDFTDPLKDAVLAAGWTWRGVLRKL